MHPAFHVAVTTAVAFGIRQRRGRFPWGFWIGSALADADHLLWHARQTGDASPVAAWRYFSSQTQDRPAHKLVLHRYPVITALALAGREHRGLRQLALGLACHRLLDDLTHVWHRGRRLYRQRNRDRLRAIVFGREQHRCQECGTSGVALELHHRIPELLGGPNHPDNLLALCRPCHDRAHGRTERQP